MRLFVSFFVLFVFSLVSLGCNGSSRSNGGFPAGSGGNLVVTTTNLPNAVVGQSYSQQLQASGGTAPVGSWAVATGSLPSGLGLSQNGLISGTPTAAGTSTFTVRVRDSSNPQQSVQQQLTLVVQQNASVPAFATKTGMMNLSFTDSGLLSGGSPAGGGAQGQSFSILGLMGTSSTVRAGERYWVQISYTVGAAPDARVALTAGSPAGGGSTSSTPYPNPAVVVGSGTIEVYAEILTVNNSSGNPSSSSQLQVSLEPNTGGGAPVVRLLTLN